MWKQVYFIDSHTVLTFPLTQARTLARKNELEVFGELVQAIGFKGCYD